MWDLVVQFFGGIWSIFSAIWQLIFGIINFFAQILADITAWLGALFAGTGA